MESNIKWSSKSIDDLNKITNYMKKNRIGEMLEVLADYYIKYCIEEMNISNYSMDFSETIDSSKISDGEYKLAFICESVNIKLLKKSKSKKKIKFQNVYYSFSLMIRYCMTDLLKINMTKTDYKGFHLTSIIKGKLYPDKEMKKDDPLLDILNLSHYLVSEMIFISEKYPDILYSNSSLIVSTQNCDISILTTKDRREIFSILETNRTLFIRILLVLTYEIQKYSDIFKSNWISKTMVFTNYDNFLTLITSPLIETLIFLSAYQARFFN